MCLQADLVLDAEQTRALAECHADLQLCLRDSFVSRSQQGRQLIQLLLDGAQDPAARKQVSASTASLPLCTSQGHRLRQLGSGRLHQRLCTRFQP